MSRISDLQYAGILSALLHPVPILHWSLTAWIFNCIAVVYCIFYTFIWQMEPVLHQIQSQHCFYLFCLPTSYLLIIIRANYICQLLPLDDFYPSDPENLLFLFVFTDLNIPLLWRIIISLFTVLFSYDGFFYFYFDLISVSLNKTALTLHESIVRILFRKCAGNERCCGQVDFLPLILDKYRRWGSNITFKQQG